MTEDAHPLQTPFSLTYMRRGGKTKVEGGEEAKNNGTPYESAIQTIATIQSVEQFWDTYNYIKRPNEMTVTTDYHCFRSGIKPTWEGTHLGWRVSLPQIISHSLADPANEKGGKWIVRLPKGLASRYWEEIVLCLIGGQFLGLAEDEICGAVLSVRYSEDILGVWNKTAADRDVVDRIRDIIKKVLQLPPLAHMEYKPHQNSIQDRSSFRNTQVWKPKETTRSRSSAWSDRDRSDGGKPRRDSNRQWR